MKVLVLYENEGERADAEKVATLIARPERTIRKGGDKRSFGGQVIKTIQTEWEYQPRILTRVAACDEVLQGTSALATDIALGKWEGQ